MDVRKSLADAGYIAVGIGVMGVQRIQVRRRELTQRLRSAGDCVAQQARELQERVEGHARALDGQARAARGRAEETVNETVSRVQDLASEVSTRVQPVALQVQSTTVESAERIVQAIEPVAARVRERLTSAA
jgi:hypothetical protein